MATFQVSLEARRHHAMPRPLRRGRSRGALALWFALGGLVVPVSAQLYWDTNAKTPGAGTGVGTWSASNSAKNWTTNATGSSSASAWVSGSAAVFSAGAIAGTYNVTVSSIQNAASITVLTGAPVLATGTINFSGAAPSILVASSSSLTFGTSPTSATNGLTIGDAANQGSVIFSNNLSLTGTVTLAGGTLVLNGASNSLDILNVTGNSVLDFASSSAVTLNVGTLNIASNATLTIQNWTALSDYFYTQAWSGGLFDAPGTAPSSQVAFTGWSNLTTNWQSWDNQISPLPEPSTYGAWFIGIATAVVVWVRRRPRIG